MTLLDIILPIVAFICFAQAIYYRNLMRFWRATFEEICPPEPRPNRRRQHEADLTQCIRRAAAKRQLCGLERFHTGI